VPKIAFRLQVAVSCDADASFDTPQEFAAPLALGRSVGDDDLDRVIVDLVANAAPPVEEVP